MPSGTGAKHYSLNKSQLQTGVSVAQAGKVTLFRKGEGAASEAGESLHD